MIKELFFTALLLVFEVVVTMNVLIDTFDMGISPNYIKPDVAITP